MSLGHQEGDEIKPFIHWQGGESLSREKWWKGRLTASINFYCVHAVTQQKLLGDHCMPSIVSRVNRTELSPYQHGEVVRAI